MRARPTPSMRRRAGRGACAVALAGLLAGCAVGPDFVRPAAPADDHYAGGGDPQATVAADDDAQRFTPGAAIAADWWTLFKSPQIDAVIKQAIDHNPGLAAASASLRQSQDALRAGYGVFYPALGAGFDASRERYSPARVGQSGPGSIFNLFTLSATVNYALDVFGGQRRQVEALGAAVDVQRNLERGTYLALAANVANALIAKAAYGAEIDATRALIALEREQVRLAQVQAGAGTAPYSTVLSLRSQLATVEATIPQLEQKLSQTDDLLATLAGRTPGTWQAPSITFADLSLPQDLPVSLPSDLARQRPDILAAEATAHAASADIGVATAAMFPSFTLTGGYGVNNTSGASLFAAGSRFWSGGLDVATPIIQGPTLWFQRKAAIDSYQAALAQYRQTVLAAFAQVADTLRGLEHDAQVLTAEHEALDTARQALQLVQANYTAGIATYTDVLIADAQYHQAVIADLQARAVRYQDTVALFTALGGGWWNAPPAAAAAG